MPQHCQTSGRTPAARGMHREAAIRLLSAATWSSRDGTEAVKD